MKVDTQKMYSYLDEFRILKTLGAGYHAQVKLAENEDGELFAIKRYKKQTANLSTLQHQLNIMKHLKHQNIIQLIDVRENALYKKKNEDTYNCLAIVIEHAGGGQLFDFIAETGRFSQKITRTYFHQMMNGLHYMHTRGFAHRDIKPENILLASDYVLKLADFGFSCLLKGKDSSGILHTKLGTPGYMAPEIPNRNYIGTQVDIFSAGVILFIMYAGNPPFEKSDSNDPYYQLLINKNYSLFWKAHSRKRSANFFSEEFRDLFIKMVSLNPQQRPSIQQISKHPWVRLPVCSKKQITAQFEKRQAMLDKILDQRREQQENNRMENFKNVYSRGVSRGEDLDSNFAEIYEAQEDFEREIKEIRPQNRDDLVLEENSVYSISVLKQFLTTKKIHIEEEDMDSFDEEDCLQVEEIEDNEDKIRVTFKYGFLLEKQYHENKVILNIQIGKTGQEYLVLNFDLQSGNRLYYKKVVKQIKKLYANCLI